MACILLWSSAVTVHDSRACRKMDVTRERISRVFEPREMLLSFQTGFSIVNVTVVRAIQESISGLEPSSDKIEPRYSKLVTISSFCPFHLLVDAACVVCHQLCLLYAHIPAVGSGGFVETLSNSARSSSSTAEPSMSLAQLRLVIVLPPMLTVPS